MEDAELLRPPWRTRLLKVSGNAACSGG